MRANQIASPWRPRRIRIVPSESNAAPRIITRPGLSGSMSHKSSATSSWTPPICTRPGGLWLGGTTYLWMPRLKSRARHLEGRTQFDRFRGRQGSSRTRSSSVLDSEFGHQDRPIRFDVIEPRLQLRVLALPGYPLVCPVQRFPYCWQPTDLVRTGCVKRSRVFRLRPSQTSNSLCLTTAACH